MNNHAFANVKKYIYCVSNHWIQNHFTCAYLALNLSQHVLFSGQYWHLRDRS